MWSASHRRDFLKRSAQLGALAGLGDFAFLNGLPPLSADEVRPRPLVQLGPDIEPLVRLIEETPRDRLLTSAIERIRGGTTYRDLLGAVMLAGVRGIQPRPVGFKFHAVLVVNSAHLASEAAEGRDRWLPLLWALDNFKSAQERNRREGDWRMAPVAEDRLPTSGQAARSFREAMDNWDVEAADRAVAALARTTGANAAYEPFWRYGARDFRDIGHKAIFVANSYRTLGTIGWRHAEPVLRSLAYALLEHEGTNPARREADADRPGRENVRRAARIRADWQRGRTSREATTELLATLRGGTWNEACDAVVGKLNDRVDPSCVWDALFLTAGEMLMRQPGIVGLHTVTTMNALHFGYQVSADDETRRLLMLQGAAFLPMFRAAMQRRGQVGDVRIDTFEPADRPERPAAAVADVFADISRDKPRAARKALALLQADRSAATPLMATARRLIFAKGSDSHDYKFSSAALEDFVNVTPAWRDRYLAASVYWLRGSGTPDTDLFRRARAALGQS